MRTWRAAGRDVSLSSTRDAKAGQTGRSLAPLRTHTFPHHQPSTFVLLLPSAGAPLGVIFALSFPTADIKTSLFLFFHLNAPRMPFAQLGECMLPRSIPGITLALRFPSETSPLSCGVLADDAEPPHLTQDSLLIHVRRCPWLPLPAQASPAPCQGLSPPGGCPTQCSGAPSPPDTSWGRRMMPVTPHGQTTTPEDTPRAESHATRQKRHLP